MTEQQPIHTHTLDPSCQLHYNPLLRWRLLRRTSRAAYFAYCCGATSEQMSPLARPHRNEPTHPLCRETAGLGSRAVGQREEMGREKDLRLCLLVASSNHERCRILEGVGAKASAVAPSSSTKPRTRMASCATTDGYLLASTCRRGLNQHLVTPARAKMHYGGDWSPLF